jgi:hypothetical protein
MSRRLASGALGAALLCAVAPAAAQTQGARDAADDEAKASADQGADDAPELAPDEPSVAAMSAPASSAGEDSEAPRWTDQGIGATLGAAFGGVLTPGGLRLGGSYLYRLSEEDWFDGAAAFSIGSGDAACFRDRTDTRLCDHGAVDGFAVDIVAAIRRSWPSRGQFTPFARLGLGGRLLRFSGDQVAGVAVVMVGGGGLSVALNPTMRLVTTAQLEIGGGLFSRGLGAAPQLGLAIAAGVEFALR